MGKAAAKRRKEEKKERKKLWNKQKETEKKQEEIPAPEIQVDETAEPKKREVIPEQAIQPEKLEVQVDIPAVPIDEQKKEAPIVPEKIEKKETKTKGGKKEMIRNIEKVEPGVERFDFTRMAISGAERLVLKEPNAKDNELYRMDSKFKAKDEEGNVLMYPVVIDGNFFAGDEAKLIPAKGKVDAYYYIPSYLVEKGKKPKLNIHLRDGLKISPDGKIRGLAQLCFHAIGGTTVKMPYLNVFPFENETTELYSLRIGISKPKEVEGLVYVGPSVDTYRAGKNKIAIEAYISLYPITQ